jgi:hypothetical protein
MFVRVWPSTSNTPKRDRDPADETGNRRRESRIESKVSIMAISLQPVPASIPATTKTPTVSNESSQQLPEFSGSGEVNPDLILRSIFRSQGGRSRVE